LKVLWLTNIPSPYRVDFFNELGKKCELTVLFEKRQSDERDESWRNYEFNNFEGIFLKGKSYSTDKAICFDVIKYLKKNKYKHIIVSNSSTLTGIVAIEYMKLFKIKYCIETDGGFAKSGKGFKEKYKKHLIKGAQIYFSTSKANDDYYLKYGAKKEKIVQYPFTSLKESDILNEIVSKNEKIKLKNELRIKEEKVILSVGRFIYGKGYDILLKACKNISNNVGIYIIGGQENEEYHELVKKYNLKNIHFLEFKEKQNLKKYFVSSDLFVLPTRGEAWGLVINEAMANGLPVITTDKCIAGLELIKNKENGYIVKVDDSEELFNCMNNLINNEQLLNFMGINNLKKIKKYTIEEMAKIHIKILGGCLDG